MAKILIVGCGKIGTDLGLALQLQGHHVTGLRRNPPFDDNTLTYVKADITLAETLADLSTNFDFVVYLLSPGERTETSYRTIYITSLKHLLTRFANTPGLLVSSTSVYSQSQGEWVDEDSPAEAKLTTSHYIRQAEINFTQINPKNLVVRFSGIYGPGRERLIKIAQQEPLIQEQPAYFTNRIHQHDCVAVLLFLINKFFIGHQLDQYYLASDDLPVSYWELVSWLAQRLGYPAPRRKNLSLEFTQNKRCSNLRLKNLGYQFIYPDYKIGYSELIKNHNPN
ncbi:MAG: NAD(P)H-binding protein [Methylococcaceae bacterium]|jgi:nucleoside-diphosphate-sugar epimerase